MYELVTYLIAITKHPTKATYKWKALFLAHSLRSNPSWQGSYRGHKCEVASHPTVRKQQEIIAECRSAALSRPAHVMVLPTLEVPSQKCPGVYLLQDLDPVKQRVSMVTTHALTGSSLDYRPYAQIYC